jgi:hypothetical protein
MIEIITECVKCIGKDDREIWEFTIITPCCKTEYHGFMYDFEDDVDIYCCDQEIKVIRK